MLSRIERTEVTPTLSGVLPPFFFTIVGKSALRPGLEMVHDLRSSHFSFSNLVYLPSSFFFLS